MNTECPHLLIVEDEEAHVEAIRRAYDAAGGRAEICVAGTLREYREQIAAHPPDLVLLDLNLPDGRAVEVLTHPPEDAPFPILVMTAFGNQQIVVEVMKAGALDYIVKSPEVFAAMPQVVERALREWKLLKKHQSLKVAKRMAEQRYRDLFEQSRDGIVVMDRAGKVVDANRRYAEMLGYSLDEVRRLHVWDWDIQWTQEQLLGMLQSIDTIGTFIETDFRRKDGSTSPVELNSNAIRVGEQELIFCICRDITARKQTEEREHLMHAVLLQLNQASNPADMIRDIIPLIKEAIGFDAVGIRLRDGDDFPYYSQSGFSDDFLKTENTLVVRDEKGGVCAKDRSICLECTCGLVLSGKTDPANPLFTKGGSAWTNNSLPLLDIPPDQDPRLHPRNRCVHDGYLSVALIPLRVGDETIGLLQLNDRRANRLSPEMVRFFEDLAASIAIGLRRAQTDAALAATRDELRLVLDLVPDAICTAGPDGRFRGVNPAFAKTLGYSVEELLAMSYLDLLHPDDVEPTKKEVQRQQAGDPTIQFENRYRHRDGTFRILEWHATPAVGGILYAAAHDVTARKLVEAALRASETEFRAMFEVASIGMAQADPRTGYWLRVNQKMCAITGYSSDELLQMQIAELTHPADRQQDQELFQRVVRGEAPDYRLEKRYLRKDGIVAWVNVNMTVLRDAHGQPARTLATIEDISDRKQAETALEAANQSLQRTLQELQNNQAHMVQQARLSVLGQLASGIAHDFNNALMPILGYAELLLSHPELLDNRGKTVTFIGRISRAAGDAKKVVSRIRLIHQVEPTEGFMPVDVSVVVRQAISLTAPRWETELRAAGIFIQMVKHLDAGTLVMGDESQLREALTNLILNAADAMPQGGVMTLSATREAGEVVLSVADTGVGMTDTVKEHCLEAFYTTKGARGSGLGLAMVAGIVGRHKGKVEIDSAPGRGTTIRLRLPAVVTADPTASAAAGQDATHTISGLRILLAEDESPVLDVFAEYLHADGHTVEKAQDGREAVAKVTTGAFDLVLADRAMPFASGDEVALAAKARNPATPVILLTGFGDLMHDANECPPGVDLVLPKPLTPQALQQAIHKVMTRRPVG